MTRRLHVLAGSKTEFINAQKQIANDSDRICKRVFKPRDLALLRPVLYIVGTGIYTTHYEDLILLTQQRHGVVHYYDTPGLLIMPALEIAHEFAEYLGIDPEWRP